MPLLLLLAALVAAAPGPVRRIQIGIAPKVDDISMVPEGRFTVVDATGTTHELAKGKRVRLEPYADGMRLGKIRLGAEARLKPHGDEDAMEIDGKRYRGTLLVTRDPGGDTVTVVEEVSIEDYLIGVLPYEMEPDWPLEALKAQAVVARTFAYTQLNKYRKEGFDLSTDTRSQVYGGRGGKENERVRQAVRETRGEVLGYKGEILPVFYHACCGGHTEDARKAWGGDAPPPLWGVKDRYCYESPLRQWVAYFSYTQLVTAVLKHKLSGEPLRRFEIGTKDRAGYALTFLARVGAESVKLKGAELRAALGGTNLRSIRITRLRKLKKGVEFVGSGSGHGVGLCQWGARLQAERGRKYETILKFYFPGSTLSVIDE